jgi:hypothetical protein
MNISWCVLPVLGLAFLSWAGLADTGTWQSPDIPEITILVLDPSEGAPDVPVSRDAPPGQDGQVASPDHGTGVINPDAGTYGTSLSDPSMGIGTSENDTVSVYTVSLPGACPDDIQCPDLEQGGDQCRCSPDPAGLQTVVAILSPEPGVESIPFITPVIPGPSAEMILPALSPGDAPVLLLGINETSVAVPVTIAVDTSFGSVISGFFQSVTDARVIEGNLTMTVSASPPTGR